MHTIRTPRGYEISICDRLRPTLTDAPSQESGAGPETTALLVLLDGVAVANCVGKPCQPSGRVAE